MPHRLTVVQATGIPVATTFLGKGTLSDRDPHSLFAAGLGQRDHMIDVDEEADCVLAIVGGRVPIDAEENLRPSERLGQVIAR